MDAERFDTLAKALTGTRSRRSALGAAIAGGVLSALGLTQGVPVRAAQDDLCTIPGAGGTCVLDFEAIVREGPSARQPLVAGGSPGRLRGYLMFTRGRTGDLEDAKLLLDDGSSLPVTGLAIGQGFQARIDFGQGQALVAVGVGEPDVVRCLGRFDGTVTSTVIGDLGEWHALAGVQNIPGAAGGGTQSTGGGARPASTTGETGLQQSRGNSPTGGSGSNASNAEGDNRPVAETSGTQPDSNASGSGNGSSGGTGGNDGSSQASGSGDRPANETSAGSDTVEARQEADAGEVTLACPESETRCGSNCVDLQADASNCGQCGNACSRSEDCRNGICAASDGETPCPPGQTRCSNTCVNTTSDVFNCGTCDHVCALDEDCTGGQCVSIAADVQDENEPQCPAGQTRCSATCTDLQTDESNCGTCGATCASGEECVSGVCTPPAPVLCPEGQVRCDGICREALPNFGSQGISCPGGGGVPTECPAGRELCNGACFPAGTCQPTDCAPGWGYCYGVCRDFQNDPGYCGGCTLPCTGNAYCQGGRCVGCSSSLTACGTDCVDTKTDLNNCGGCGNLCGTQCINGECTGVGPTPGCAPGTTRCGNACVDLTRDPANCGTCGKVCSADSTCYPPGECGFSAEYCETLGKQACGLGCVPRSDPFNCGGCGQLCPGGYACDADLEICYIIGDSKLNGVKPKPRQSLAPADQQTLAPADGATCAPGLEACDGVCSDLTTDMLHCGSCGNACVAGETCQAGTCATPDSSPDDQVLAPGDTEPETGGSEPEPASPSCPEGQVECSGTCADLTTDSLNCGACGVVCGPDVACVSGACSEPSEPVAPGESNVPASEDDTAAPIAPPESAPETDSVPEDVGEPAPPIDPDSAPADGDSAPAP
ncbi:MAG: hypothetical protein U0075_25190 [Thermomicrobiales bacterium]